MQRLQTTTKWNPEYDRQLIQLDRSICIPSLNTHNFQMHINDILNDYDTMECNLFFLQETYMT